MEFKFSFNGANKTGECVCNTTDHEAELWQENFSKFAEMFEWFNDNTSKSKETADAIANAIITFCDTYSQKNKTYTEDVKRRYERQWRSEEKRAAAEAEAEEARRAKDKDLR